MAIHDCLQQSLHEMMWSDGTAACIHKLGARWRGQFHSPPAVPPAFAEERVAGPQSQSRSLIKRKISSPHQRVNHNLSSSSQFCLCINWTIRAQTIFLPMNEDMIISLTKGIISYYVPTVQSLVSNFNLQQDNYIYPSCYDIILN